MRLSFRAVGILAILCCLIAGVAQAQTNATIRGKITDESGNPFPTAEVTATSVQTGYHYNATADAQGNFLLNGLNPGTYRIDVVAPSYKASSRELTVSVGQDVAANFKLQPDLVVMESITVIGSQVQETRTPELATVITPQQMETLPQNDRNFLNFAALAPGVLLGTDEFRKEVKAGAQSSSSTNVFIDGVSFKNDVIQGGVVGQDASRGNPFPQNAVQEFKVITQNYSAEYQKASSAIITAVTKTGSNELTGDAFLYYQDKGLVAENPLNGLNPEYERKQYGLSVGGPIIRDRMHFFVSYEANDQDREETVALGGGFQNDPALRAKLAPFAGTFGSPFRSDLAFGKISYQMAASSLFDVSANYRKETDVRGFGGETSFESAENAKQDVWGLTGRHQYTASTWYNELTGSIQDFHWNPSPTNPGEVGFVYEGLLRIGGRDTEQDIGQRRLAFRDDVTFSNLNLRGTHTLKVGGNVEFLDYTATKFFEENPRYFFRSDLSSTIPYKARFGLGNPDLSADNQEYGLYAQDEWVFNRSLTLNLGLRWDYETNMMDTDYVTPADVRARLSDDFPSKFFTDGNDREPKSDMFQPRLGFSYDLKQNGRTVIFGGAGRYYDRNLFNNTLDERFRLQHSVGEFFFSPDGSPVFGQPAVKWDPKYLTVAGLKEVLASGITGKPEVFLVENDTKVPYSNQWNIGVRQSFGNYVASASYANIKSYNGFSYLWGKGFCCPQVDPAYSNILISSDDVRTWYDAIYLQLDRPYTSQSKYGFNIAYTYADAEQVGGDLFSLDLPTIADWPRYGTPGTQDHRIVASGIVGLPWDTRLSTLIQYSSGDKFRIHDFSKGFCVGCYHPRTGESPAWTTVDLRAEKDFGVLNHSVGVTLEAFNLFNEQRYAFFQDFNPPEGNPNLGKPTAIVGGSQRRYQIGLRFRY
ncbi:MAG TPA: TonB-dependent receptor [Thermoanaerobaculia bacterium]|nr:TonB-dependent receptor [Thermoanaerobaculia bacterium]